MGSRCRWSAPAASSRSYRPSSRRSASTGWSQVRSCSAPCPMRRSGHSTAGPGRWCSPPSSRGWAYRSSKRCSLTARHRLGRDLPAGSGRWRRAPLRWPPRGLDCRHAAGSTPAAGPAGSQAREAAPSTLARFSWPKAAATFVACYRSVGGLPLDPEQARLYEEASPLSVGGRFVKLSVVLGTYNRLDSLSAASTACSPRPDADRRLRHRRRSTDGTRRIPSVDRIRTAGAGTGWRKARAGPRLQ